MTPASRLYSYSSVTHRAHRIDVSRGRSRDRELVGTLVTDALATPGAWTLVWLDEAEVLDALLTLPRPDGGARTRPSGHLTVVTVVVDRVPAGSC